MSKWISVKDSLPDDPEESYLIYCPELEEIDDFPGHSIMISNPAYLSVQAKKGFVSHWTHIPKPPEDE